MKQKLNIGFFNVGDVMHRVAAEARVHFTNKVLDSDPAVLSLARRTAFYEIARRAEDYEHAIIGLHACFRWRGSLIEGFSFKDIEILLPDLLINVVDNITDISERMEKTPQWAEMGKAALNVWLDEEEFLTRQLAHFTEKPHYTVARQHDLEILSQLSNYAFKRYTERNRENSRDRRKTESFIYCLRSAHNQGHGTCYPHAR